MTVENEVASLKGLFAKIAAVMGAVGAVEKTGKHQQGYTYQSWDDVAAKLNRHMAEQKLICIPEMVEQEKEAMSTKNGGTMYHYTLKFKMHLCDGDSGDCIAYDWQGEAWDQTDKGIGKATTYAVKEFLKKIFMISTKEDVDTDQNDYADQGVTRQTPSAGKPTLPFPDNGQTPPPSARRDQSSPLPETSQNGSATPPEKTTTPNETTPLPTLEELLQEAESLGFERGNVSTILASFKFPVKDGKARWSVEVHEEMLHSIRVWKQVRDLVGREEFSSKEFYILATDKDIVSALQSIGAAVPLYAEQVEKLVPVLEQKLRFNVAAADIVREGSEMSYAEASQEAGEILRQHKFDSWTAAKEDLMLQTLRNYVAQAAQPVPQSEDVIEEFVTLDDALATGADADEDDPIKLAQQTF